MIQPNRIATIALPRLKPLEVKPKTLPISPGGEIARGRAEGGLFLAQCGGIVIAGGTHFRLIVVLTPWPSVESSNQRAVTVLVWV